MQRIITTLLSALPLLFLQPLMAQNECADFHKFNCMRSTDARFSVNGQSKSAPVQVGQETELNIIVYRGQDYRITLCHDDRILGEKLVIRLVEKVRVPRNSSTGTTAAEPIVDEEGNTTGSTKAIRISNDDRAYDEIERVLWDNTEHEMVQEVEFSCTATKRIAIEVNAAGTEGAKLKKNASQYDIGCVGILIEHMTSPTIGF